MSERATFVMTKSIEQQTLDVLLRIEALLLSRQAAYTPNETVLAAQGVFLSKGKRK